MKMRTKALRVQTVKNWSELDYLDKHFLRTGELLRIFWPDGTEERLRVTVERRSETVSDMGNPWEVPIAHAFVTINHHGATARIRLADTAAICTRVGLPTGKALDANERS